MEAHPSPQEMQWVHQGVQSGLHGLSQFHLPQRTREITTEPYLTLNASEQNNISHIHELDI